MLSLSVLVTCLAFITLLLPSLVILSAISTAISSGYCSFASMRRFGAVAKRRREPSRTLSPEPNTSSSTRDKSPTPWITALASLSLAMKTGSFPQVRTKEGTLYLMWEKEGNEMAISFAECGKEWKAGDTGRYFVSCSILILEGLT